MEIEMTTSEKICAVVVTYNRKKELSECVRALLTQSRIPDLIHIVDNGSNDGTEKWVRDTLGAVESVHYENLGSNQGGGGGFYHGCRRAFLHGYDWIWLMDDDCVAPTDCLANLLKNIDKTTDVYSPLIISSEDKQTVLWGIRAKPETGNKEITTLPFNGFFVSRSTLEDIGLPEKRFFIYGDDADYTLRAKASGRKVILVTNSIMYHPLKNKLKGLKVYKMFLNRLWAYYKLRNAIIIYSRYGYYSRKQAVMLSAAFVFYVLTLNFGFMRIWLEGFRDGINGRLYVRNFD